MESTVRYLGIQVGNALEIAQRTETHLEAAGAATLQSVATRPSSQSNCEEEVMAKGWYLRPERAFRAAGVRTAVRPVLPLATIVLPHAGIDRCYESIAGGQQ